MLILYTSPVCPYCHMVTEFAQKNKISLDLRDITDGSNMDDLIVKGGKMQVPFFVDEEKNAAMYESRDIVAYLDEHYVSDKG